MPTLRWIRHAWRNVARRHRTDADLEAEIRAHLDLLIDEHLGAGLPPEAARRQALVDLGGAIQLREAVQDARAGAWLGALGRDVQYGVRVLARRPLATGAAILALALGIGAATSVFSVVNGVLLRPLPYSQPDRLAVILHGGTGPVSAANYLDWKGQMSSFAGMGAAEYWRADYVGDGEAEKLYALRVTPGLLPMLGVRPALGRLPASTATDTDTVAVAEVVLSHRLWQRRFAGDPAIVGRTIRLDGLPHTVVGVMPAGFLFAPFWATNAELWAPLALGARARNRGDRSLRVFARLQPDVSLTEARAEVRTVTDRLEGQFEGSNDDVQLVSLTERVVGDVRQSLVFLFGAVGFVLLLTCANVAHMLLAHGAARAREFGLRLALGASTGRLVRQVLTESLLLVGAGGLAGVGLAWWGVAALRALGPPEIPRLDTVGIDTRVLLFAAAVSLLTGMLFGALPAWRASRSGLAETVRPDQGGDRRRGGRGLLVTAEFTLALMLLAWAGLTVRSFLRVQDIDPGFNPSGVLSMTMSVTGAPAGEPARRGTFYQNAVTAVAAVPGVLSASAINHLPLAGDVWGLTFRVEGRPEPDAGAAPRATYRVILPGYFATMGIPLLRGRDLTAADGLDAEPVAVVSEYFADRHWPGEDALGRRFALRGGSGEPRWMRVVGIARNAAQEDWLEERREEMYLPMLQSREHLTSPASHYAYMTLVVRTTGDPELLVPSIREAIWRVEPGVPLSDVQTMASVVARETAGPRFYMVVLSAFGIAAIVLAAVGVYGVMSVSVAERRREFGIRLALGARPTRIVRLVVGEGLRLAIGGTVAGLAGALLGAGAMSSLVHGIAPTDPATLAGVSALLVVVALLACYLPARRATRADALAALRND